MIRGVIAGALIAGAMAACAARGGPSASQAPAGPMDPAAHDEIGKLDAKIAASRQLMNLPEPAPVLPLDGSAASMAVGPTSVQDPACHPGDGDACRDTCALADQICADAGRICELARQLPGDAWAAGKCSSGQQSCDAAHGRCCGCI